MNYDAEIQAIINQMKADKSILQPYKNYAAKAGEELKAWIHMGQSTTRYEPEMDTSVPAGFAICICPGPGARNPNCRVAVHES